MNINSNIAVGVGYYFTITNSNNVKGIALENTNQLVKVNDEVYPLYKGKTYEDSQKIDFILDNSSNEMKISPHLVNKYELPLCKGEDGDENVLH